MFSSDRLQELAKSLSAEAEVLSEPRSERFQTYLLRWSDIGRKTPRAIVLPRSEHDCQTIIKWAVSNNVHFVAKSGGMSLYSNIGEDGIVIDLTEFVSISHDGSRHEAVLTGGITSKAVAVELAKHGHCTTLPSSNPVGAVPFFLNGGNSPLVAKLGYGSDNILSARMITATGEVINVSDTENQDLLYAIRGAGQYFGLVTSLTVRTYPVQDIFGNGEGTFWSGRFVYPIERADEVSHAVQNVVNNDRYCIGGLMMVAALPPAFKPGVAVMARLIHPDSDSLQKDAFKSLYDLGPLVAAGDQIRIENNADALAPLMAPSGFKKLRLTGMTYKPQHLVQLSELWQSLIAECPDAQRTMFGINFESQSTKPVVESANGMHSVRFWANNLVWCYQEQSVPLIQQYLEKAQNIVRAGQTEADFVDFANSLREPESPINRRYRSDERMQRLQDLKRQVDPEGIFSNELL